MKHSFCNILSLLVGFLLILLVTPAISQSISATYTYGIGSVDGNFTSTETSSNCPLTLGLKLPQGATIIGVDVEYSITSIGEALMSQQVSQLRCISSGGTNESDVYFGAGESSGTFNYKRTNLNIASNVGGGQTVFFELHVGITDCEDTCSNSSVFVNNNWKITVNFATRAACSITPFGGLASCYPTIGCNGVSTPIYLSAQGYSQGLTGLSYKWQRSTNGSTGWTDINGETNPESAVFTVSIGIFFRLAVSCLNTGEISYSNVISYTVSTCQSYNIGSNSNPLSTCNAMFYDSGGNSDYGNSESKVVKFCSNSGNHVRIEFLSFDTEDNGDIGRYQVRYDKLVVFDGASTLDPPMFEFSGLQTPENKVPIIISSGECLSFRFTSDASTVKPGWVAHVSCTDEENNIASQYCVTAPNICNLNGYQGATSNFYNIERVNEQIEDTGPFFPGNAALDNNSFITFIASSSTVVLNITVSDCHGGFADPGGIQFVVYSGSDCSFNSLVSSTYYIDPGLIEGTHNVVISNLVAGNKYYMMTDGNYGAVCNYSITATSGIELAKVNPPQTTLCEGHSAIITASGGSSFHWSGPSGFSSNQASITVTEQGVYTVTITGGISDCPSEVILNSVVEVIPNVGTPTFNIPTFYCKGSNIPALPTTSLNGIVGIWTPALNNNQTTTYTFLSNNGVCAEPYYHTITISPNLIVQSTPPACFGGNGVLTFSSNSQQLPLTFRINGIMSTSPISLPSGTYTVSVTDINGCTASQIKTISDPEKLLVEYFLTDRSCYGKTDADIKVTAEGGFKPYTFGLLCGEMNFEGEEHFNLTESEYTVMVRDRNNCTDSKIVNIYEPAELMAEYISHNPSCIGNIDGFIELFITGGTEPYTVFWDNDSSILSMAYGLNEGVYDIIIADTNLCNIKIEEISLSDLQFECLSIPNAFSPNSDGINDIWVLENLEIYTQSILNIYNRWGQLIYSGNCAEKWDGTYNDRFVPSGPYVYLLILNDGTEPKTGIVTVVY